MPEDVMVPAGDYKLVKQIRRTQRRKKDLPWTKRVFDIDEQKLFGRTAFAWLRITLYYLFLYFLIFLIVAFWVTILLLAIIDPKKPRWLKGHPGLSMVPNQNRSVLEYFTHLANEVNPIADRIDDFLNKLNDNAIDFFSDFNQDTTWGYATGKPTVFIKLNKVIGFQPETYDTPDDLPKNAPSSLQGTVGKLGNTPKIWLTCEVTEGPKPDMVFYPGPYFEASEEMTGVTRVVAIQMNKMPKNSKVFFHCKVWARNIPIDNYQGTGHLKFALNMRFDKDSNQASTHKSTTPRQDPVPPADGPAEPNEGRPEDQLGGLEMPPSPENERDALDKMGNNPQKEDMTEPPS